MRHIQADNNVNNYTPQMMLKLLTLDCFDDLVGHVPDLVDWKGLEIVLFEEIERAQSKKFKRNAHMAMVVKPVKHTHKTAVTEERNRKKTSCLLHPSVYIVITVVITSGWNGAVLSICTLLLGAGLKEETAIRQKYIPQYLSTFPQHTACVMEYRLVKLPVKLKRCI